MRHGNVENPKGVIYGRLPGYHLSEKGKEQAAAAADRLRDADIGAVWASPLERAQETGRAIAEPHGLGIVTDDRLIESRTTLEGVTRSVAGVFRNPSRWWHFRNPMRPSWGESFTEIKDRMMSAIEDAVREAGGKEIVVVSHQTPVLVARYGLGRRKMPPWLGLVACETGSVTTMVLEGDKVVSAAYFKPAVRVPED